MMLEKQKVYIETSVISYLTARPSRDIVISAHQQITYEWWHKSKSKFDCYISQFVIDEINKGDQEAAAKRMKTIQNIPQLEYSSLIENLANEYITLLQIPEKSKLDAYHLAIAVLFEMDYLLSWNCKHISNSVVSSKLGKYNTINSLFVPILCTPLTLMEV